MARIKNPRNFLERTVLTKSVAKKNAEDGEKSVLLEFLENQNIDLAEDVENTNKAIAEHNEFNRLDRESTKYTEERNLLFEPVFATYRKECQYLKKYYVGKERELVDWGIPIDNQNEIKYPKEFDQRTTLVEKLYEHNAKLANKSPLTVFLVNNKINPVKELENTTAAQGKQTESTNSKKMSELHREERDNLYNPVWAHTEDIGQYLKNLFPDTPKKLGEWGYIVDDTDRLPVQRTTTIPAASTKTIKGIKLDSEIENTGKIILYLHKGDKINGTPTPLEAGNKFKIQLGWGTTTIENKNGGEDGEISYEGINGVH